MIGNGLGECICWGVGLTYGWFTCGTWPSQRSRKSVCILLGSQPQRTWSWFISYCISIVFFSYLYYILCILFNCVYYISSVLLSYLFWIFKISITLQLSTVWQIANIETRISPRKGHLENLFLKWWKKKRYNFNGVKSSCSPVSPRDNSGELVAAHEWTWKMVFDKDTHNLILFKLKKNLKNSFLTQFVLHFSLLFSHIISYFNVLPEIRMIDAIETKNVD